MGQITAPPPVKLFAGVLTSRTEMVPDILSCLAAQFGPIELQSDMFPFDATRYYDEEMGTPISRIFVSFEDLIPPEKIAAIKRATNDMEAAFATGSTPVQRPVNLDPGYLEESKIVLASTKNFYHRILLAGGIYAEVTLHFSGGCWHPFPWTFPDFRSGRYDGFFSALRRIYRDQRRGNTASNAPGRG
jgi:hypothetical protein